MKKHPIKLERFASQVRWSARRGIVHPLSALVLGLVLVVAAGSIALGAPAPEGMIEFTGRLAHNHWYLIGEEHRSSLEALNRELRESSQRLDRAGTPEVQKDAARARRDAAADRLLALVRNCPSLLRLDLNQLPASLAADGPVELPGDSGALLLRIDAGPGPTGYTTAVANFSEVRGESSVVMLDAGASGTTYALATLERVPLGRTSLVLEVRRAEQPAVRLPLEVRTPESGRLRLSVLADDTGEPGPAMVRLLWRVDGINRRPSNGIDFAPHFDSQGNSGGPRAANLPGSAGVHFWVTPGPFDMALAPGSWQIGARRGVEHDLQFADVDIRSGQTTELELRPKRWVNMKKLGWWSGDDHVHSQLLSDDDARRLMVWVKTEDIHLANVVKMGDIYRTYFEQRGFGKEHRFIDGDRVLSPGQECPRTHDQLGHTLAMNITAMVRDTGEYFLYDRVFDAVQDQGGLSGYAHVNSGMFHVHRDMTLNIPRGKVDFVELLQFNRLGTDLYYEFLNLGFKMTASAGSDVPWGGSIGEVRVYTFLGDEPFSADAWFAAFGRGRTFTTSGPMIDLQINDARPGDELRVQQSETLRIRARAWGDPGRMSPVRLEIVRHGKIVREATSSEPAKPDVGLDFEVEAGNGCWIAGRAFGGDGTSAHTTPVYVVREGLRFWDFDALDSWFTARQESLRQIEQIVAEAQREEAGGRLGTDRYRLQLARQGSQLLERVASARRIYGTLKATAEAERPKRALP